jgi:hypothetical protein
MKIKEIPHHLQIKVLNYLEYKDKKDQDTFIKGQAVLGEIP